MTCTTCQSPIPPTVFAMFGPKCDACRHPPLTVTERAAWAAMMERIRAMPDPNGEIEAAPPLEVKP
jgi:hypothetical protein